MIGLLAKIFIKGRHNTADPAVRLSYGVLCGTIGIALNLILFAAKLCAGAVSGSIAVTADAFNNLSDAASSVITLIGFKLAGQKPDSNHPFGHGRLEYVSGLIVAFLILLMAVELLKTSVVKILRPELPECSTVVVVILLAAIAVKGYMAFYNHRIGVKIDSSAMKATATDSRGDMIATATVLVCTLISYFTGYSVDGWCGVAVALFIGYSGLEAVRDTVSPLLGKAPDPKLVRQIEEIVLSYEGIVGVHDLEVHDYGPGRLHISLHAEVPATGDILEMHDLIDLIEHTLKRALHCSAVIHMDPVAVGDPETEEFKAMVLEILGTIDPVITVHDFRIVKGPTHTNLIFDAALPYDFRFSDGAFTEILTYKIKEKDPKYFPIFDIDHV